MKSEELTWEKVRKGLDITPEQEAEIQFEEEIIQATIEARKNNKLSQRELSKKTGIKQSAIARIEKCVNSPQINTLIRVLYPLGYTLKVVPIEKK